MSALDFPAAPTNGQVFVGGNGVQYVWNGTLWLASSMASQASDTPPANPQTNQLWFNSSLGQLFIYYTDANSSQWVPANPTPSGVPVGGGVVAEFNVTTSQSTIDVFNIPSVRSVKVLFYLNVVGGSRVDMLMARGAVVETNASAYIFINTYNSSTAPNTFSGTFGGSSAFGFNITGGVGSFSGEITYPSLARGHATTTLASDEGTFYRRQDSWFGPANCNGFRFYSTGGNFAAGSFVRVIGWP